MMKYKLQEEDYLALYPYLTPRQISEEFGESSLSERSIQKIYKKLGMPTANDCRKKLIEESIGISDLKLSEEQWASHINEYLENTIAEIVGKIREKAQYFQRTMETINDPNTSGANS